MPEFQLGRTEQSHAVRAWLLAAVREGNKDLVSGAVERFGLTRQTIHKHLTWLVENDYLTAEGATRSRAYRLGEHRVFQNTYLLQGLDEHVVHQGDFSFIFRDLPDNIAEICDYGFTEMVNNAVDHSEGRSVYILAERTRESISITVRDDGEGIFLRIARLLHLHDPRESLLELSKGKLTTDPEHHTGEGIFFTSRAFDEFSILSDELAFTHGGGRRKDYLLHMDRQTEGTLVYMEISCNSKARLGRIFDEYSSGPEEYRFDRTVVPVRMALHEGERLLSRSQARRILNRVDRFKYVVLDFESVDSVGQAFADEVFRVFARSHPEMTITAVNETAQIGQMISRAQSGE
jgi:anti-sigma regulatory factor (Ser/Thr protein kinase)